MEVVYKGPVVLDKFPNHSIFEEFYDDSVINGKGK